MKIFWIPGLISSAGPVRCSHILRPCTQRDRSTDLAVWILLRMPLELVIPYRLSHQHSDFLHPVRNAANAAIMDTGTSTGDITGHNKVSMGGWKGLYRWP